MGKKFKVFFLFFVTLCVFCTSFTGVDTYAEGESWVDVSTADALKNAIDSGTTSIRLTGDIPDARVVQIIDKPAAITIDLNGHTLNLSDSFTYDGLIEIENSEVIICDSTISTQADYEDANKYAVAGKITGGRGPVGRHGGIISVSNGGKLTLDGGVIYGGEAGYGGGVSVIQASSFTMKKGCIDFGKATRAGAGVYIGGGESGGSTFTMENGFIRGNKDNSGSNISINGGGVYVSGGSTFNMNGGQIGYGSQSEEIGSNSIKGNGGGVYVKDATFNFSGGSITENVVTKDGGGIYLDEGANFTMTSGEIYNNQASAGAGAAICVCKAASCDITGGKIYENQSGNFLGAIYISGDCSVPVKISNVEIYQNYCGIYNEGTDVTLDSVTIKNNKCAVSGNGAGVYDNGNLKLVGKNYIYDNKDTSETRQANIYLTDGKLLEIPSDLPDDTKIGVWSDSTKPVKLTDGYGNKANTNWKKQPEKFFVSDNDEYFAQKNPYDKTGHEVYMINSKHTHSISEIAATTGDCMTKGTKEHIKCTTCGRFFEDTTGAVEIDIIDVTTEKNASNHAGKAVVAGEVIDVEPTCTKAGSKTVHYNCDKCKGEMKTEKVEIDALGHKFGDWVVTKEATTNEDGVETRTCSLCGTIETRPIKATPSNETSKESSKESSNSKAKSVRTGDEIPVALLFTIIITTLIGMIYVLYLKRKYIK